MTDLSDAELLVRLSDPAALDQFYRRHRGRVLAYAMRRCFQPADVADLVAQTFLAVVESASSYDARRPDAGPWIIGIAARQWGLWCRNEHKQRRLAAGAVSWAPSSDDIVRLEERIDAVRASRPISVAMGQLDPSHQEVLLMVGPDGLTYAEAARALGITGGALRVRLFRARRALRAALDEAVPACHQALTANPKEI